MAVKMPPAPDVRTRRRPRAQYHLQCIGFLFVFVFVKPGVYASCRPGYYGNKCVLRCNCLDVNENCDPDGFCSSGCRAGYIGSDCMEKCPVKTYGVDCEKKCVCGDDCPCDPVTGACIYSECKHPQNSSDGSDKTGVWITLALLGLIVFFVATALLLNYLRSNRVGLLKKLKVDSLEKYRRSKKKSSAPAKEETYEEVAGKIYIPLKQPDDHPAQHQDDYVARDDGRHPPGPESNTLMNTKQPDPCKDNAHPGDSITGNSFKSTKRDSKRNVLYVPKASVVRETVHQPVYENVAEVKGRRFKSSDSPELAEDGSDGATTLQMEAVFPSPDAVASLPQTNMFPVDHRSSAVKGQRLFTASGLRSPEINAHADVTNVIHGLREDGIFAEQHLEDYIRLSPAQPGMTETHNDMQVVTPASLYDTTAISLTGIQFTNVSPTYLEADELLQQKSKLKQSPNHYANRQNSPSQDTRIPRKSPKSPVEQHPIKSNDSIKECSVRDEALKTFNPYHTEKKEFRDILQSSTQSSCDTLKSESDAVHPQEDDIYESCIDTESSSEGLTTQNGHSEQPDAEIKSPPQPSTKRRAPLAGAEVTEQTFSVPSHAARSSSPVISSSIRSRSPQQRTIAQKLLSPKSFDKSTPHVQQQSGTVPYSPSSPDISTQQQWSPQTDRLSASLTSDIGHLSGEAQIACPLSGSNTFPRKSGDERESPIPLTNTASTPHVACRLCKPSTNVTADNENESSEEKNLQTSPLLCKSSQEELKSTDAHDPDILKTTRTPSEMVTSGGMKETTLAPISPKDFQQMLLGSDASSRSLNTLRTSSRSPPQCPSRGPQSTPQRPLHGPHSPQKPTGIPSYQHGPDGTLSPRQSARDTPSPRQSARDTPSPRQSARDTPSPRQSARDTPSPRQSARDTPSPRQPARDTPSPRQSARDTPSPRQPVHGPQHSPTRIPYRTGRVGTKGGNWEAFEHTHYHLMGASAHQVQRTADSQSVPEPAGEEPLVVEVSEDPSGDSQQPCDQAHAQIYMNTSATENV